MNAEEEYEPTEEDYIIIREWIAKMPHLVQDFDDRTLRAILLASKGRMQRAKKMLEAHNGFGYRFPKLLGHLDPLNKCTQAYFNATYIFPLPKTMEDGSTIFTFIPKSDPDVDLTDVDIHEVPRILVMSYLVGLWENLEGNTKIIVLGDLTGERIGRAKTATPKFMVDFIKICEDIPLRLQAVHFANIPRFVEPIANFWKSLIPNSKIANRVYFHSTLESVHKHIPKHYLPMEYGGTQPDLRTLNDNWKKTIESYRDKLIEENNKMRSLDHLRPKDTDEEIYGTFRQLKFD